MQCEAYLKAWRNKIDRERAMNAALQHIIAVSGGVKIKGRQPRFEDFYQNEKRKESPEATKKIAEFQRNVLKLKEEKYGKK